MMHIAQLRPDPALRGPLREQYTPACKLSAGGMCSSSDCLPLDDWRKLPGKERCPQCGQFSEEIAATVLVMP